MATFTMNLEDDEHRTLKMYATSKGLSIKEYIMSLFRKDLKENKLDEGYSFEDFNEETQKAILKSNQKSTKRNTISIESIEQYKKLKESNELDMYDFTTYKDNKLFFDCLNLD